MATPNVTIPEGASNTPGVLVTIPTSASAAICIQVPQNDLTFANTGMNGTSTSSAYILIASVNDGTNIATALSTSTQNCVYIPASGSATIRGLDCPFDLTAADGTRKVLCIAVGNAVTMQIIKGVNPVNQR